MLKDTKSDTQKKGPSGMAQSDGFPGNIAQKNEQYHIRHKGRVRRSMKLDNNDHYNSDRKSLILVGRLHQTTHSKLVFTYIRGVFDFLQTAVFIQTMSNFCYQTTVPLDTF